MKNIKKIICIIISLCVTVVALMGCGVKNNDTQANSNQKAFSKESFIKENATKNIICTIFPMYDWVNKLVGDNVNINTTILLDNGVDLHNYQPTTEDIINISNCDMFIYVGGESDEWVEDVLASADNKQMIVINLLEVLGNSVKEEELIEGMESEHEHEESDDSNHEHEIEYDEHVWLSLKNAKTLCSEITYQLQILDTENADTYTLNANNYIKELNDLDIKYQQMADSTNNKTVVFGDRFPFKYLMDDYDLEAFAAFAGCSAETEASFETVFFLAQKIDELDLDSIVTIEGTNHSIAEAIRTNTKNRNQKIYSMNSAQSVTSADIDAGITYLSIMENNLNILSKVLN